MRLPTTGAAAFLAAAIFSLSPPMSQPLVAMPPPAEMRLAAIASPPLPFVTLARVTAKPAAPEVRTGTERRPRPAAPRSTRAAGSLEPTRQAHSPIPTTLSHVQVSEKIREYQQAFPAKPGNAVVVVSNRILALHVISAWRSEWALHARGAWKRACRAWR